MTFLITMDPDNVHGDAYLSLIASTIFFLYQQPQSGVRDKWIAQCIKSLQMVYDEDGEFMEFNENLESKIDTLLYLESHFQEQNKGN